MKNTLIFSIAVAGLLSSCVKDEGVYNFLNEGNRLNEVSVKGLEGSYNVGLAFIDNIEIVPEIEGTVYGTDESHYEYTWYRCRGNHTHDTLSNERALRCRADFYPGTHNLYFVVKDKDTGVERNFGTSVITSSPFTRGYLVVGNRPGEGKVAIDMLSMVQKDNASDTVYVKNVLSDERYDLRNAEEIIYTGYYMPNYERWYLKADGKCYQMNFDSEKGLTILGNVAETGNISCALPHIEPVSIKDVCSRQGVYMMGSGATTPRFYMTEDLIFMNNPTEGMDYMFDPVNRYDVNSENLFKFYPKFFYNTRKRAVSYTSSSYSPVLVYDYDHECFCYFTNVSNQKYAKNIVDQPANGVTVNNAQRGYTLHYGENDYANTNGRCNALLKHKTNGNYMLCQFTAQFAYSFYTYALSLKGTERQIDMTVAEDLDRAEHFYFDGWASQMMYSVGNTLYVYDYVNKRLAKEVFDAPITCLQTAVMPGGNNYNQYWVGTFNGTKGMLYKMATSSDQNKTEIFHEDNQTWEVEVEPISIMYSKRGTGN